MDFHLADYGRFFFALVAVLALIALLAGLARKLGYGYGRVPRSAARRLRIVESLAVDSRRRLLLVRRDSVEHLILLGSGPDLLIESGIAVPDQPSPDSPAFRSEELRREARP